MQMHTVHCSLCLSAFAALPPAGLRKQCSCASWVGPLLQPGRADKPLMIISTCAAIVADSLHWSVLAAAQGPSSYVSSCARPTRYAAAAASWGALTAARQP